MPLGVQLQGLDALVLAAVIHSDSDGLGILLAQSSGLQLLQGEPLAGPDLDVVFVGGAVDRGPQLPQGTGSDARSLGHTGLVAADLPGWLVEPSPSRVNPLP